MSEYRYKIGDKVRVKSWPHDSIFTVFYCHFLRNGPVYAVKTEHRTEETCLMRLENELEPFEETEEPEDTEKKLAILWGRIREKFKKINKSRAGRYKTLNERNDQ